MPFFFFIFIFIFFWIFPILSNKNLNNATRFFFRAKSDKYFFLSRDPQRRKMANDPNLSTIHQIFWDKLDELFTPETLGVLVQHIFPGLPEAKVRLIHSVYELV